MMTTVPKDDFRPLVYLLPLGGVGAATVGVFFGVGILLLTPPRGAAPPALPDPPIQAEAHEVPPPADNDTARDSTPGYLDNVAARPMSDTPPTQEVLASRSKEMEPPMETTLIPLAGIAQTERVEVGRPHHRVTGRHRVALWRSDARAGPNPGGGFYGPPNINIGHINPR
jgi:hypothetical protein